MSPGSSMDGLEIEFAPGMASVEAAEWDGLAAPYGTPLLSHGFLSLLEESGSICPETGWTPAHALARRGGRLVAAAPFYVKAHSWGEFVFDFEFAEIAERARAPWYPKLVGMVPATPAPAWRVLVREAERANGEAEGLAKALIDAAEMAAREAGTGGIHLLWPEPGTAALLRGLEAASGPRWAEWEHQAFIWEDRGYGDFSGYLESFSKNMRRNVRREREAVAASGLEARVVGPAEAAARPELLEAMADLYESHNAKFGPWAARFLERDFFLRLPEFLNEGWALSAAFDPLSSEPVALAFLLEGRDRLYGRFWGCRPGYERGGSREVPGLHFELCYYLPIEYALAKGIGSFDPGMGSPHKARRGFRSISAPSFHEPFDPRLARLMARVLPGMNAEERASIGALNEELPFKRGGREGSAGDQAGESTL